MNKQNHLIPLSASILLLFNCISLYYITGIFGNDFPVNEVVRAIPISIVIWCSSAWIDPPKYRNIWSALACIIFGSCVFTGAFLLFEKG